MEQVISEVPACLIPQPDSVYRIVHFISHYKPHHYLAKTLIVRENETNLCLINILFWL